MKRNYVKPDVLTVELQNISNVPIASPNGLGGTRIPVNQQQQGEQEEVVISTEGDIF